MIFLLTYLDYNTAQVEEIINLCGITLYPQLNIKFTHKTWEKYSITFEFN